MPSTAMNPLPVFILFIYLYSVECCAISEKTYTFTKRFYQKCLILASGPTQMLLRFIMKDYGVVSAKESA